VIDFRAPVDTTRGQEQALKRLEVARDDMRQFLQKEGASLAALNAEEACLRKQQALDRFYEQVHMRVTVIGFRSASNTVLEPIEDLFKEPTTGVVSSYDMKLQALASQENESVVGVSVDCLTRIRWTLFGQQQQQQQSMFSSTMGNGNNETDLSNPFYQIEQQPMTHTSEEAVGKTPPLVIQAYLQRAVLLERARWLDYLLANVKKSSDRGGGGGGNSRRLIVINDVERIDNAKRETDTVLEENWKQCEYTDDENFDEQSVGSLGVVLLLQQQVRQS
jgi:hypothetical protein